MQEYLIHKKDLVEHEAEIVLSGCIEGLQVPKIYQEGLINYWVYDFNEEFAFLPDNLDKYENRAGLYEKCLEETQIIKEKISRYMLRAGQIIFSPKNIDAGGESWRFQYLPSKEKPIYSCSDLLRHSMVGEVVSDAGSLAVPKNILFFKNQKHVEKLMLKQTIIGSDDRCTIKVDFDGSISIANNGVLSVLKGDIKVNDRSVSQHQLEIGDIIRLGKTEIVYF